MRDAYVKPAVLLDRDGVLNVDIGYAHRREDLKLTASAGRAVRLLNDAGHAAIVVSNQSGVARGMFGCADVDMFHHFMQDALASYGARIDAFYYCPFHPDGRVFPFVGDHADRKPRPGMLLRAIADWSLDRSRTTMIGDKQTDMEAAHAAGIKGVLVRRDLPNLATLIEGLLL